MSKRRSGCGPFAVLILIGLVVGGWSLWWHYVARQIDQNLLSQSQTLRAAGWTINYDQPRVDGYPFRSHVTLTNVEVTAPSGHGVRSALIEGEAMTYQLGRWVLAAPDGLSLGRGAGKGWTDVSGEALRASLSSITQVPPRIVIEFDAPQFAAQPGATPFPITQADRLLINLNPDPEVANQAALMFELANATPRPGGVTAAMAEQRAFNLSGKANISQAGELAGKTWREVISGWTAQGGQLSAIRVQATAEDDYLRASSEQLRLGENGRLNGELQLDLRGGTAPLIGLASAPGVNPQAAQAVRFGVQFTSGLSGETGIKLRFAEGRTHAGIIDLAPAPKLF